MGDFPKELPTDGREKFQWESKYGNSTEPKKRMRIEAIYLIFLLLSAFICIILNYEGVFHKIFKVPNIEKEQFSRIVYCLSAGLLGGVTFSIKVFYRAVARGYWNWDRIYWRIFSPLISLSVTSVVAAFMIDSVLNPKEYWAFSIGYFAGYFSENAVGKMCDIAIVLFSTPSIEKSEEERDESEKSKKS